jgi:PAS domain S-box-containing protein
MSAPINSRVDPTTQKLVEHRPSESRERFARIFEVCPVALGLSTIDDGRIVDVNESWLNLFGYSRDEVIGRTNAQLGISVEPPSRVEGVREARKTGYLREKELRLRTKSGEVLDAIVSAVRLELTDAADEVWLSAIIDITQRKMADTERSELLEAERAARAEAEQAVEKLRAVYAITDSVVAHSSLDELLQDLLGRVRRTLRVDYATVFLMNEDRETLLVRAIDGDVTGTIVPSRFPIGKGVSGRIAADGKPLIVTDYSVVDLSGVEEAHAERIRQVTQSVMGVPLCIGETVVGVLVVSTTARREFTNEELKLLLLVADRVTPALERVRLVEKIRTGREQQLNLSRRLLTAQEEERRRLAVELHDELGQLLTAVKINLEFVQRTSPAPGTGAALDGMITSVDEALQRVRDIALDLRPSVLDDLGLSAALRWYADRLSRTTGLEVHVSIDALPDLDKGIATACFRVAQEALTNAARHAQAEHVWLDLHLLPDRLQLLVRDDGIGFDIAAARERAIMGSSIGLLGMQERVALLGGEYDIVNVADGGVEVRAQFQIADSPPS